MVKEEEPTELEEKNIHWTQQARRKFARFWDRSKATRLELKGKGDGSS